MSDHLKHECSDRGFFHMPVLDGSYGDSIRVYESSLAREPHIWLCVNQPGAVEEPGHPAIPPSEAIVHLSLTQAQKLVEQIQYLAEHHYLTQAQKLVEQIQYLAEHHYLTQAQKLVEQIQYLAEHHYHHGGPR